jgi:hypothetical protein
MAGTDDVWTRLEEGRKRLRSTRGQYDARFGRLTCVECGRTADVDRTYGHLAKGAEDAARSKLDAYAARADGAPAFGNVP